MNLAGTHGAILVQTLEVPLNCIGRNKNSIPYDCCEIFPARDA